MKITREVYQFYFFNSADSTFGRLSIAADTEWKALTEFNHLGLIFKGQTLIKFIEG